MTASVQHILLKVCLFCALAVFVATLALPLYVDLAALILLLGIALRADLSSLLIASVSFFITLVALNFTVQVTTPEAESRYRDHERYAHLGRYLPNVNDVIDQPHGDLSAVDAHLPLGLREARRVHFQTDSFGFRNSREYLPGDLVLNGDSFTVANGTDQDDTLGAQLLKRHQLASYNIAFPSDPKDYYDRANEFLARPSVEQNAVRFVFLFYEGNDFSCPSEADALSRAQGDSSPTLGAWLNSYDKEKLRLLGALISPLRYPQAMMLLSRRLERSFFSREQTSVSIRFAAGKALAFLDVHSIRSECPAAKILTPFPPELQQSTNCVVFVPTKWRVYYDLFDTPEGRPLPPSSALTNLQEQFIGSQVQVLDLTPALVARARELLPEAKYVFWRDDTHWNAEGIRVAASQIAACLQGARE